MSESKGISSFKGKLGKGGFCFVRFFCSSSFVLVAKIWPISNSHFTIFAFWLCDGHFSVFEFQTVQLRSTQSPIDWRAREDWEDGRCVYTMDKLQFMWKLSLCQACAVQSLQAFTQRVPLMQPTWLCKCSNENASANERHVIWFLSSVVRPFFLFHLHCIYVHSKNGRLKNGHG